MNDGSGISTYLNTEEIYKKLNALVAQPLRPVKPEVMKEYLRYFDEKCAKSKL